jgi:hypothetical protein
MRCAIHGLVAAALLACLALPAVAAEPYLEFADGLRKRDLHDVAVEFLERAEADPKCPKEVKEVIPYEKAMILMEGAKYVKNLEQQTKQLDQAEAFLEQFTKATPNHPKAAQANTDRANILLGKARVEVQQARSPANAGTKAQYQAKARDFVAKARVILQAAHDQHKTAYDKFPSFIPQTDKEQYEARREAEIKYIKAQLDLALSTYESAQTYDPGSAEFNATLTKAADEFRVMHERYRTQVGGLYARMWQAKCFEEQEDLSKAMGIYKELLEHPNDSDAMRNLQNQVTHFRLICLNHDKRKDYLLVVQEASEWLLQHKTMSRTNIGLGIRYERARANEALGTKRELSKAEKDKFLQQALNDAKEINRFSGQYKDATTVMVQKIQALVGNVGKPKDFDTALGLGRTMAKQIKDLQDSLAGARATRKPKEEITKIEVELDNHLKETADMLRLALDLAEPNTEVGQINAARYYLAFVYYYMKQSYEAAILGEFVARRYPTDDPQVAQDMAYIAMSAWQQAYYALKKEESHDAEMAQMIRICNLITKNWPEGDNANEARMNLGKVYKDAVQPVEAAKWYGQVPETSKDYADSQINAGQAYWTAWLNAMTVPADQRPPAADLDAWTASAEKHLRTGIEKLRTGVPMDGVPPDAMVAAQVSLSQIMNATSRFADSVKILVTEAHPVVKSIDVKEGEARPDKGVKGKPFYILTYTILLRAYVGTQEIDKALAVMNKLETVAGGPQSRGIVAIYEKLGEVLEEEIKQRKAKGGQGLAELQASFNKFLDELYKRRDTMSYGGLRWIGQTYQSLGNGLKEDKAASADYFNKAESAYNEILAKAEKGTAEEDTKYKSSGAPDYIRIQIVMCRRQLQKFDEAYELIGKVLDTKPRMLEAQMEAAYVLQDWGFSGQGDSFKKLMDAIKGSKTLERKVSVWGWAVLVAQLQKTLEKGAGGPDGKARVEEWKKKHLEAGYNQALCYLGYGKAQSSSEARAKEVGMAKKSIEAYVRVTADVPEEWWTKYDALYKDIQKEQNPAATPVALARPEVIEAPEPLANMPTEEPDAPKETTPKPEVAKAESSNTGLVITAIIVLLAGGGGVGFFMFRKKPGKPESFGAPEGEVPEIPLSAAPDAGVSEPVGEGLAFSFAPPPAAGSAGGNPFSFGEPGAPAPAAPRKPARPAAAKPAAAAAAPKPAAPNGAPATAASKPAAPKPVASAAAPKPATAAAAPNGPAAAPRPAAPVTAAAPKPAAAAAPKPVAPATAGAPKPVAAAPKPAAAAGTAGAAPKPVAPAAPKPVAPKPPTAGTAAGGANPTDQKPGT